MSKGAITLLVVLAFVAGSINGFAAARGREWWLRSAIATIGIAILSGLLIAGG